LAAFVALLFFAGLGIFAWVSPTGNNSPWVKAAKTASPVTLPAGPPPVADPKIAPEARAQNPDQAPATQPSIDATREAALVAAEDNRLRSLIHHSSRITAPTIVVVGGSAPTLILPPQSTPYTITDLQDAGAVTAIDNGKGLLLTYSVLLTPGAQLTLGPDGVSNLYMQSSTSGFTSLVSWGGKLSLAGASPKSPLSVTGWDTVTNHPAADTAYGRPYIRAVGGQLDLTNVHVSSLGFWSGRTGGVAWTGLNNRPSTGGATGSSFVDGTYGAFVSRGSHVNFTDDLFQGNELDGLRLHRGTVASTITGSTAARNGGNGFVASRGATGNTFNGDMAVHNAGNGFLLNGQPLVGGASPSGDTSVSSSGTSVTGSEATNNLHTGILVEGGANTVVQNNVVSAPATAIGVRTGATSTTIVGNDVILGGRTAISIGPGVTGTTVDANRVTNARIGVLVRNSPGVRIMNNYITGISVFGVSVRGNSPGIVGNGNVIAGVGLNAVDSRAGAPAVSLVTTNTSAWQHRSQLSLLGYLRYHPVLTTWILVIIAVIFWGIVVRVRRRPRIPYKHTVPWQNAHRVANINAEAAMDLIGIGSATVAKKPNGQSPQHSNGHSNGHTRPQPQQQTLPETHHEPEPEPPDTPGEKRDSKKESLAETAA